jgi:hypothetical protein
MTDFGRIIVEVASINTLKDNKTQIFSGMFVLDCVNIYFRHNKGMIRKPMFLVLVWDVRMEKSIPYPRTNPLLDATDFMFSFQGTTEVSTCGLEFGAA